MFADFSPTSKPPTRRKGLTINPFSSNRSGLGDSNARPLRPERSALPTALNPDCMKAGHEQSHRPASFALQSYIFFLKHEYFGRKICIYIKDTLPLHPHSERRLHRNVFAIRYLSSGGRAMD